MPSDVTNEFHRVVFTDYFIKLVAAKLGDRSHLAPSDEVVFQKVSAIIWNGSTPAELAVDGCPAEVIVARHKEWAAAGIIARYLFAYPGIAIRLDEAQMFRE